MSCAHTEMHPGVRDSPNRWKDVQISQHIPNPVRRVQGAFAPIMGIRPRGRTKVPPPKATAVLLTCGVLHDSWNGGQVGVLFKDLVAPIQTPPNTMYLCGKCGRCHSWKQTMRIFVIPRYRPLNKKVAGASHRS